MYRRAVLTLAATFLLMAAFATSVFGQATGGSVTGTVLDAQGGAVAGATINLRDKQRGQTLTTQSTDAGTFSFPNAPVGEFTLSVEQAGFAPANQDLKVSLNQSTTVDVVLQAGNVSATVDVVGGSEALVQTDDSQLSRSFETRQVTELPIFGDQNALALLSPNVVQRSGGVLGAGGSVGGTRPRGNSFNVDGVDNNSASVTGPLTAVIQEAIQEFSLLTNNYNAEFGVGAGGQFNTITKSGTNEFHGSGFYYAQSEKFNAATTLQTEQLRAGDITELQRDRDYRYGFTIGGPVLKNKLFFFGAYERENFFSEAGSGSYFVPTAAGLDQIAGLPGASPFSVGLLRNNVLLAPTADFLNPVLDPNVDCEATPNSANCIPFGEVTLNLADKFVNNLFQFNVDHLPNSTNQFRYRFNYQKYRQDQKPGTFNVTNPKFGNLIAFDARLFSMTWVRTISSNLVNDLRLAYRRSVQDYPLKDSQFNDFPNIYMLDTGIDIGPAGNLPQGGPVDNNYQVFDTVSYTRGDHSFKFGVEYRNLINTSIFLPRARGDYIYLGFDEFIQDLAPGFRNLRGVGGSRFTANQQSFFAFGQDDWKVTPNLTLNLGLRYEYVSLPRDAKTQILNSVSNVPGIIEFGVPKTDKNNLAPRVGFAYSPEGRGTIGRFLFGARGQSSIRANFGITYYSNFLNLVYLSLPPQIQTELNFGIAQAVFGTGTTQFLENGGLPPSLPPATTTAQARISTSARIPDLTSPYSIAWTLSYQRELTPTTSVEFRYLSTRGRHLPVQVRLNQGVVPNNLGLPTFFSAPSAGQLASLTTNLGQIRAQARRRLQSFGFLGEVTEFSPVGNSQYDSGSVSVTRRFSRGLSFTSAYTFSKTIDDSTNELNSSAVNPRRPQDAFNLRAERGLSALDIPHRFAASVNYDVPYVFKYDNKLMRAIFGGFRINAIFQAQSGQPVTAQSGQDSNLNGDAAGDRAIFNPAGTPGIGSGVRAINAAGAFVALGSNATVAYVVRDPNAQYIVAGPGAISTAGRNSIRTRGFNRTDAAILKDINFAERYTLQIGAEIFDLFNQRPKTLNNDLSIIPGFVTPGNANFLNYDAADFLGRVVQLRAKFTF